MKNKNSSITIERADNGFIVNEDALTGVESRTWVFGSMEELVEYLEGLWPSQN